MNEINIFLLTLIVFCYIQLFLPTYVYNWTPLRTIHILLKCLEKFQQFSTWSWWKRSLESVWFSKPPLWNLVKSIMWHCSQPMSRTNKLWHFFYLLTLNLLICSALCESQGEGLYHKLCFTLLKLVLQAKFQVTEPILKGTYFIMKHDLRNII